MKRLKNIHPGEILQAEFLEPMGVSVYRVAKETGLLQTQLGQIIKGMRSITAESALRLGKFFGVEPQFWLNIQAQYDLEIKQRELARELKAIKLFKEPGAVAHG